MSSVLRISPEMAEVLGVLLGDGCRSKFMTPRGEVILVAFTGFHTEFSYYQDFVQKTIEREFKVRGYLRRRPDRTVRYFVQSKALNEYLDYHHIPIGKRRDASIPSPIIGDKVLAIRFVRGFYHAEGSIYRRYSKMYPGHARVYSNLLVIQIRTKLRTLMTQLHLMVNGLGISTTRLVESQGVFTFRITRQDQISRFLETIQPLIKASPRTV